MPLSPEDRSHWKVDDWAEYIDNCRGLPKHVENIKQQYILIKIKGSRPDAELSDSEAFFGQAYERNKLKL